MEAQMKHILDSIAPADAAWIEKAKARTARLVMPARALGRLHDLSEKLCGMQRTLQPVVDRKAILVMAGDHGVVEEGVNPYPQEITGEMVRTFLNGGAGINALSKRLGAEVWVADLGIIPDLNDLDQKNRKRLILRKIARGTANLSRGPAMSRKDALSAVMTGFELARGLFDRGVEILGLGDMGIGNTTPSAAIGTVMTGRSVEEMVGRGTGVDDLGLSRKQDAVRKGIRVNQPDPADPIDVLSKVGGFEIGGIAGGVLAGAFSRCPVVIDGFISTAGALIAHGLCPTVTDYLFAGHRSEEAGHRHMLEHLELDPILDLGMRLGEGTGAALAMGVLQGAVDVFRDVMTFEEAQVSKKTE